MCKLRTKLKKQVKKVPQFIIPPRLQLGRQQVARFSHKLLFCVEIVSGVIINTNKRRMQFLRLRGSFNSNILLFLVIA